MRWLRARRPRLLALAPARRVALGVTVGQVVRNLKPSIRNDRLLSLALQPSFMAACSIGLVNGGVPSHWRTPQLGARGRRAGASALPGEEALSFIVRKLLFSAKLGAHVVSCSF